MKFSTLALAAALLALGSASPVPMMDQVDQVDQVDLMDHYHLQASDSAALANTLNTLSDTAALMPSAVSKNAMESDMNLDDMSLHNKRGMDAKDMSLDDMGMDAQAKLASADKRMTGSDNLSLISSAVSKNAMENDMSLDDMSLDNKRGMDAKDMSLDDMGLNNKRGMDAKDMLASIDKRMTACMGSKPVPRWVGKSDRVNKPAPGNHLAPWKREMETQERVGSMEDSAVAKLVMG
ncbi:hypothetical protein BU23DRAFT_595839 [Bimuria novae-zelandiae CBS 107.79]|uniref:Pentapeptide MXKDX repeat protein n=1 Tax=Bimuria novae-zelandiae CBS 107.79 TaxID=1447943 RepID=A0A6A5VM96_9PLEO|nr:hypothetical protein BU23DRAFT_595839 [Bimuria novae-zelandiae CBS 107.79]